jgi:hypothetical protein
MNAAWRTGLTDAAARQGLYGGLLLGVVELMVLFVANEVLPESADWAHSGGMAIGLLMVYAMAFFVIGMRGARRSDRDRAGARAGAVAGFVVAVTFIVTFALLDNVFYPTVIEQPGHIGATHASLNGTLLGAGIFVLVAATGIATLLGEIGGSLVADRRPTDRSSAH